MSLILLFLAILPTIVLGYFIYSNDKIEKEPISLLIQLALGGVGAVILTLIITFILCQVAPFFAISDVEVLSPLSLAIYVFFGIAIIEEFSKWILLYGIAWKNKAFNHVYDAIVYSVFVSLGFATIENILYVFISGNFQEAIAVALNRMIFSVPGHAFFGVMMGYYIGIAKLTFVHGKKEKTNKFLLYSLMVPTICHFIFDYLLMVDLPTICFFIFVIALFGLGLSKVKRLSNIPTNIFDNPTNTNYIYNAFNNKPDINNNPNNSMARYCHNCGTPLIGPFCGKCGAKNY